MLNIYAKIELFFSLDFTNNCYQFTGLSPYSSLQVVMKEALFLSTVCQINSFFASSKSVSTYQHVDRFWVKTVLNLFPLSLNLINTPSSFLLFLLQILVKPPCSSLEFARNIRYYPLNWLSIRYWLMQRLIRDLWITICSNFQRILPKYFKQLFVFIAYAGQKASNPSELVRITI